MKKNNPRIKYGSVTLQDKINAIEKIADSYFSKFVDENGDTVLKYTPYLSEIGEIVAIASYFIEGVEFEEGENIYDAVASDSELSELVDRFLCQLGSPKMESQKTFAQVMEHVHDIVEYRKAENVARLQNAANDAIARKISELVDEEENRAILEGKAIRDFNKLIDEQRELNSLITPEMQKEFVEKFDASTIMDTMMEKFADSGLYKKNQEIRELSRKVREAKAKEVDG